MFLCLLGLPSPPPCALSFRANHVRPMTIVNDRALSSLGAFIAIAIAVTTVRADEPSREATAAAEAAFDEGKRLVAQGQTAEGCAKLEASQRLAPASGTLLNLADCYERLGRTATAWATFRASAAAAAAKGNAKREAEARARASALEPRLSKVRFVVSEEAAHIAGLEIRRGELVIAPSLWNVAVPVDPGSEPITASAPSYKAWTRTIEVARTPGIVDISIPKLDPEAAKAAIPPSRTSQVVVDYGLGSQRSIALVLGGVGVASLAFGIAFGVDAIKKKDASNGPGGCRPDNLCPPDALDVRSHAVTEAYVSTALFVGAAAAIAGGTVLWLTAKNPSVPRVAVRIGTGVSAEAVW